MRAISCSEVRYRVDPADVPPDKAARRLHLTLAQFESLLPRLLARGFPSADPDTGMYDLEAIDLWRRRRNPSVYGLPSKPDPVATPPAQLAESSQDQGLGDRFRAAKKGLRRDPAA